MPRSGRQGGQRAGPHGDGIAGAGPRELCAGDEFWLGRATLRFSVYATDASTRSDDSGERPA